MYPAVNFCNFCKTFNEKKNTQKIALWLPNFVDGLICLTAEKCKMWLGKIHCTSGSPQDVV